MLASAEVLHPQGPEAADPHQRSTAAAPLAPSAPRPSQPASQPELPVSSTQKAGAEVHGSFSLGATLAPGTVQEDSISSNSSSLPTNNSAADFKGVDGLHGTSLDVSPWTRSDAGAALVLLQSFLLQSGLSSHLSVTHTGTDPFCPGSEPGTAGHEGAGHAFAGLANGHASSGADSPVSCSSLSAIQHKACQPDSSSDSEGIVTVTGRLPNGAKLNLTMRPSWAESQES